MLLIKPTNQFRKDLKLARKRGKNIDKLEEVINSIQAGEILSPQLRDHALKGQWHDHRECHIEPDWLLIYRFDDTYLFLERVGSHADLF